MFKHKVAVIIPCYNAEKYISRCLDSVVNQTFSDLQIIIVNNLSSDLSKSIIDSYAHNDKRIEIVNSQKQGLPYAINDGLSACDSEYVCFIDADDYIGTDMVQKLVNAATSFNADVVQCNYCRITVTGKKEVMNCFSADRVFSGDDILEASVRMINFYNYMDASKGNGFFSHSRWAKLIKTELLKANEIFVDLTMSIGEDFNRMLPIFVDSKVIVAINDVLYFYVKNPTSITSNWAESRKSDNTKLIKSAVEMAKAKGVFDKLEIPLIHKKCQIETDYILRVCRESCPYSERKKRDEIKSMRNILNIKGVKFPTSFFKRSIMRVLLKLGAYGLLLKVFRNFGTWSAII